MGVYKELLHELEKLQKMQHQVYPDSCDEGLRIDGMHDPIVSHIQSLIHDERMAGPFKKTIVDNSIKSHSIERRLSFNVPYEREHGDMYICNKWTITYYKIKDTAFFTIDSKIVSVNISEIYKQ